MLEVPSEPVCNDEGLREGDAAPGPGQSRVQEGEQENHQRYRVRVVRLVIAELAAWQAALWRHDDWKARRGAAKAEITVAQHHTVEDILAGGKQ
ncbi:hypothetical protein ACFSC4_31105 [Deinococcus malanensis]|uniref:hypothetical protein n=1 Tax=Deinococcus malanensis TaxID=1706855 RepID=UPI00363B72AE